MQKETLKKKHFCIYLFVMMIVFFWLLFSNSIIAHLSSDVVPQKVYDTDRLKKDDVYYGIDAVQAGNNLGETLSFSGWAFIETADEVNNKQVSIILKNEEASYQADCNLFLRSGLQQILSHDLDIQENLLGFSVDISTIVMKDGVYDLYVYCKENEETYGIVCADYGASNVGLQIVKSGPSVEYCTWIPETPQPLLQATQEEWAIGAVDFAGIEDGRLNIWGWAFAKGINSNLQNAYLELTNENGEIWQYETKNAVRDAVVEEYHDEQYRNCGYRTSIPVENIPDGQYEMRILLQNGNEVWTTETYSLIKNGENVSYKSLSH